MTTPDDLRRQAKELFDLAKMVDDADERLIHVLKAIELEADADALERRLGAQPAPPADPASDVPPPENQSVPQHQQEIPPQEKC